ncbi:uncharacterized protein LOC105694357 [Orussus abietinus]|uniref:uncharacterized protein LOC105694357 n=1 Tax=Orussus abietinus TaxID=222816 RepID=UPI0006253CED|nr:uncharacterized protein LOC105694357 [Orussus abietinus]
MRSTGTTTSSTMSAPPCSSDEVAISPGDCVEGGVEEWLEDEALAGFRVWQLAAIVLSVLLALIVALCCCIRFRVPRTKQEIEADYIRKKITRSFGKELTKIANNEMDEMDLRRALDRVKAEFDADVELLRDPKEPEHVTLENKHHRGFLSRFTGILRGMRAKLTKDETKELRVIV